MAAGWGRRVVSRSEGDSVKLPNRWSLLRPWITSVLLGCMAGPLLAGTFPGVAAATTGCDIQTAKEGIDGTIDSNGDFILRAGTGFGSHGLGGQGMWLGDADPISCIRVSSIYSVHDNSNFEEMGAAIIAPGSSPFCDQPSDGHWQRFWFEVVANSKFCSSRSQDVQETQNTFYNVALFLDAQ